MFQKPFAYVQPHWDGLFSGDHRILQLLKHTAGKEHVHGVSRARCYLGCVRKGCFGLKNPQTPATFSLGAEMWGAGNYRKVRHSEGCDRIIKMDRFGFSHADSLELNWLSETYLGNDKW